jgi:hypothetical protein
VIGSYIRSPWREGPAGTEGDALGEPRGY